MISQFFILSERGDALVNRDFRAELVKNTPEVFFRYAKGTSFPQPIVNIDGINFCHIKKNSMYFVATTALLVPPSAILELLVRVAKIIKDSMGQLAEQAIRKNFVLVYELLDQIIDYGHPQLTSTQQIKPLIVNKVQQFSTAKEPSESLSVKLNRMSLFSTSVVSAIEAEKSILQTNQKDQRIYVDIQENINMLFNSSGYLISSSIDGSINLKNFIKNQTQIRLLLNDVGLKNQTPTPSIQLEDCNFHNCVNESQFQKTKALRMKALAGQFSVMNFRCLPNFAPPIKISPIFQWTSPYKLQVLVKLYTTFNQQLSASKVCLRMNVPAQSTSVFCQVLASKVTGQKANHNESAKSVQWLIDKINGQNQATLSCKFSFKNAQTNQLSVRKQVGPLVLGFEVPSLNLSGVKVVQLRLSEETGAMKLVRYISKSNSYVCRI